MNELSFLTDKDFLKSIDNYNNKFYWVKIEVLGSDDIPIQTIEGRAQSGSSISLNGSSSVRRTCNLTIVAEKGENDLTNIDNLLSANKKIKIFEGIQNSVSNNYDKIIWFPLGVFVIIQPNISHNQSGCIISLSCKDKMCLLNGECAGGLPTSVTFHEYDQIIGQVNVAGNPKDLVSEPNNYTIYYDTVNNNYYSWTKEYSWQKETDGSAVGTTTSRPQRIYDIIQTLVCNYGGESLDKIFINDVPLEIKQIVRFTGSGTLYYNTDTGMYTLDETYLTDPGVWRSFKFNEDVGYVYTDFTYPGKLVSSIGENVASVLEKIKNTLGNYEYYYDIEGNFIFQEIKNYLNNSYDPTDKYRLDNNRRVKVPEINKLAVIDDTNYEIDSYSNTKSVYTFTEGNGLIASFNNAPNYNNLKNDFHIWGENTDGYAIHYHLAIKNKPSYMNTYQVIFLKDGDEYTGGLRLAGPSETGEDYTPSDWRAELYLQGLMKKKNQQRPDVYEQELLDLFDSIYDFHADNGNEKPQDKGKFKTDLVYSPNNLNYFFDYLEPINKLYDCSVDVLNTKVYSYQQDKIKKLYNVDIPNIIMIDVDMDSESYNELVEKCEKQGQPWSNVDHTIYSKIAIGTVGYTAQEVARDLLYQYTTYNETISLTSIPIYYLDVNSRITVQDRQSGIFGDYIIHNITLPLDAGGTMSISASRALERI